MANEILDIPNHRLIKQGKWGQLKERYVYKTRVEGFQTQSEHITLFLDGTIWIKKNFEWDFGSGPAVDTPAMVAASCVHDALYTLIEQGKIPGGSTRKLSDKTFKDILKAGGTSIFRRYYCYFAVRKAGHAKERLIDAITEKFSK